MYIESEMSWLGTKTKNLEKNDEIRQRIIWLAVFCCYPLTPGDYPLWFLKEPESPALRKQGGFFDLKCVFPLRTLVLIKEYFILLICI